MSKPPPIITAAAFPSDLAPVLHRPSVGSPTNVILFLSGLGDTSTNFSAFAKALNLPDTLAVTLQGPFPLPFPFGPGNQWSEDVQVDTSSGTFDPDSPLGKSTAKVVEIVVGLVDNHGFRADRIHLFGYGQGGSLALTVALHEKLLGSSSLGSIVSFGGTLPTSSSVATTAPTRNKTPVLLLGGSKGNFARDEQSPVKRIKNAFEFVEYHQWRKADDGLPKSRDEAMPMMAFLARRLKSTRGVPERATEV